MRMYDQIYSKIKAEATLSPSKRTQVVPCAFCGRGGNGDKSCSCGWDQKRYSKFNGRRQSRRLTAELKKRGIKCRKAI